MISWSMLGQSESRYKDVLRSLASQVQGHGAGAILLSAERSWLQDSNLMKGHATITTLNHVFFTRINLAKS